MHPPPPSSGNKTLNCHVTSPSQGLFPAPGVGKEPGYEVGAAAICRLVCTDDLYCCGSPDYYSIRKESVDLTIERSSCISENINELRSVAICLTILWNAHETFRAQCEALYF